MPSGRLGHTATLLPDCRVLIVGDAPQRRHLQLRDRHVLDAGGRGNGSFQRSYQTATLLTNGKVLIAGGETVAGRP